MEPQIYNGGSSWKFNVKHSNKEKFDTLEFKSFDEKLENHQIKSVWKMAIKIDSGNIRKKLVESTTGIVERHSSNIFSIFGLFEPKIWIHPPRILYMRLTEMVPFPYVEPPIEIGDKYNWELTPKEGWEELKGKTVTGKITVDQKIFYENTAVKDSCFVLNARGKSEVGDFQAKYYFSSKKGFVYFFYDFNDYTVEIVPFEITNN